MRLGGGIIRPYSNPDEWMERVRELGYSAVVSPINTGATADEIAAYCDIAKTNNVVIAEIGVWRNAISPDDKERAGVMEYAKGQLALADEMEINCCVNVSGSRGEVWDGCYADNYSPDTYTLIVDSVREIIDAVKPSRTFYTLEPMPWMRPDSPEDYLKMIKDIDRPAFAVHLDFANMINSIEKYINSSKFIEHCYELLGPHIKSIHAKDVTLSDKLPCNISEAAPGKGTVDFAHVLRLTQALGDDMPLFAEHLHTHEEYRDATNYIRSVGKQSGVHIL